MTSSLLILDVPFLAHRATHALGELSHEGEGTEIIFGLLRDVIAWQELFRTNRIVFAFDYGRNKRIELYPEYKAHRHQHVMTDEQREERRAFRRQLIRVRTVWLEELGYRNVFCQEGYEADDVIASVVQNSLPAGEEAVIVSSDSDLYQLLSGTVSMWNPAKSRQYTLQSFSREYGLSPVQWADVKALAGCDSDNVRGVRGVGEVRAAKYIRGELGPKTMAFKRIASKEGNATWERNLKLVRLPFEGTETFELREDEVTKESWIAFCESKGIDSLKRMWNGRW